MVATMPARKRDADPSHDARAEPPPPPSTEGLGREWKSRKDVYKSVALYRDVSDWATELADDADVTVAAYLDKQLRTWLWNEYRAMLARKMKKVGGE